MKKIKLILAALLLGGVTLARAATVPSYTDEPTQSGSDEMYIYSVASPHDWHVTLAQLQAFFTGGLTITTTTGTFTLTSGKTLAVANSLTLAGMDGSTLNIGAGGTLASGAFAAAYTLPTATTSVLGGVKVDGSTITISGGVISASGGGSLSLGSNASAVMSYGSGTLDLVNAVNTANGLVAQDGSGNINISGSFSGAEIDTTGAAKWADVNNRLIYDQYNEQAFSSVSDTWNTDSETTIIADPDYGYAAINGSLFIRQGLHGQPFGGSDVWSIDGAGNAFFQGTFSDSTGSPGASGYVLSSTGSGTAWISASGVTWPLISTDGTIDIGDNDPGVGTQINLNNDGTAAFMGGIIQCTGDQIEFEASPNPIFFGTFGSGAGGSGAGFSIPNNAVVTVWSSAPRCGIAGRGWFTAHEPEAALEIRTSTDDASADLVHINSSTGTGGNLFKIDNAGLLYPLQAPTTSAPAYVEGAIYFDTTLHKLRVGGASGWETVSSSP